MLEDKTKEGGSGWSGRGMTAYNNIWKWVILDRYRRGQQFNGAFLDHYQSKHVEKEKRKASKKEKVAPFSGLNPPTLASLFPGQNLNDIDEE